MSSKSPKKSPSKMGLGSQSTRNKKGLDSEGSQGLPRLTEPQVEIDHLKTTIIALNEKVEVLLEANLTLYRRLTT